MDARSQTEQRWYALSWKRIVTAMREAGRLSMRDLQRKTHYTRAPAGVDEPQVHWFAALEALEKRGYLRFELADGAAVEMFDIEYRQRAWAVWTDRKKNDVTSTVADESKGFSTKTAAK